jgi:acetyl-CoA acetyltransferase
MKYALKDSGERQVFNTGAQRDIQQVEKGRYDLISPIALKRIAIILAKGAKKYSDRNWEKGMPMSRYIDSSLRHLTQYIEGKRDEDHLGQAFWNLHSALHMEEQIMRKNLPHELLDLPCYLNEKNMDENTLNWWKEVKKLKERK